MRQGVVLVSARVIAEENIQKFSAWIASKTDADFRAAVSRGVLSRTEIAKECGFAKSVLAQNPRVREALRDLEDELRARGVLPPAVAEAFDDAAMPLRQPSGMQANRDAERLKRLEQENASLRAENSELRKQLERYVVLQEALSLTGRIPR